MKKRKMGKPNTWCVRNRSIRSLMVNAGCHAGRSVSRRAPAIKPYRASLSSVWQSSFMTISSSRTRLSAPIVIPAPPGSPAMRRIMSGSFSRSLMAANRGEKGSMPAPASAMLFSSADSALSMSGP